MSAADDCIFCKIARGELPAAKVFETEAVLAFLDIRPIAPGHVLVIPKAHHASLLDTPDGVGAELGRALPRLARAVQQASGAPGLTVVANTGREAGQEIDHVHFHLIPRRADDPLQIRFPQGSYGEGEQEAMRRRIAEAAATGQ